VKLFLVVVMSVLRGFVITLISGISFAVIGAVAGYLLGSFAPDYYRVMFRVPPDVSFNVSHAGLGLGVTQGFAAGCVVGLVIVVTVAWYNSRVTKAATASHPDSDR
jgi:predicted ribosomally synthesized peptide with SipW-like signal peptide